MENVCGTCGDEGFVEALVYCDSCKSGAVHRYCCGITPVPIDGYVTWFCSDCDESDTASDSIQVELQDTRNVDVSSSSPPVIQAVEEPETRRIPGRSSKPGEASVLEEAGDGGPVLEMSENENKKKKKKKRKISTHSLPDATIVEAMEETKKQDGSENGQSDELNGLVRNETSVLDKSGKKKKTIKGEENEKKTKRKKKNQESSTHTLPVLEAEGHVLQDVTSVEAMKESTMPKCSENRESEEMNILVGNEVSVLEKSAKKKKKKKRNEESSNHTSPVVKAVDCGHPDTTSVEAMKKSKKHKTSDSRVSGEPNGLVKNEASVLEKSEKKKQTNEENSNNTAPVLAGKNSVAYGTSNVELTKAQESSASRKPDDLAGLEENGASVSEGGNSTNVPDHSSCTTRKNRSLSSRKIQVTSEIMELPANNSSCKEAESNLHQTNEVILALNNNRAQPVPIWRGSITIKQGSICSIHGLVAYLSTLASPKVHEKAGSLRTRLSAEMFPRLDIWPPSFLKNGPPTDNDIAVYFFPSPDSSVEKVYYSLVDEMKKKDLAMRCLFDDVQLLIFTSYQLPLPCWKYESKEYLWGIFGRRKISRQ